MSIRSNLRKALSYQVKGLVLFDRGRVVPRSDCALLLELVGRALAGERTASVLLVGHANLRESPRSAELLGLQRAKNVAKILTAYGARPEQLQVESCGTRVPFMTREGSSVPALNRRVEIVWRATTAVVTSLPPRQHRRQRAPTRIAA